jgi:hypothetical protein
VVMPRIIMNIEREIRGGQILSVSAPENYHGTLFVEMEFSP